MLADWSSIWAGFGIVWVATAVYAVTIVWRLRRVRVKENGSNGQH
ncbi:MAG TPA: hypothetical protein VG815_14905 [Chloroflexota bacterium]|jgi:hypothetical protein|nr:hypothetical protein [Chloroflexota bacterium]